MSEGLEQLISISNVLAETEISKAALINLALRNEIKILFSTDLSPRGELEGVLITLKNSSQEHPQLLDNIAALKSHCELGLKINYQDNEGQISTALENGYEYLFRADPTGKEPALLFTLSDNVLKSLEHYPDKELGNLEFENFPNIQIQYLWRHETRNKKNLESVGWYRKWPHRENLYAKPLNVNLSQCLLTLDNFLRIKNYQNMPLNYRQEYIANNDSSPNELKCLPINFIDATPVCLTYNELLLKFKESNLLKDEIRVAIERGDFSAYIKINSQKNITTPLKNYQPKL
jgi:hypothetical protein